MTNKGTKSPQFGGHGGGGPFTYVIPTGQRLAGIYGHKDQYIRGLGFYMATASSARTARKLPVHGNYGAGNKF